MANKEELQPIVKGVAVPPRASRSDFHIWCDYVELRCITHKDKRFSRDALIESIMENTDIQKGSESSDDETDGVPIQEDEGTADTNQSDDRNDQFAFDCFRNFRWRASVFKEFWPFQVDASASEISLKKNLTNEQLFYVHLLLSSSLRYCPKKRWPSLTNAFEKVSYEIMKCLMPRGAQVHQFGAASSKKYTGHLYDRLTALAEDVRGTLTFKKGHFKKNDSGDGGLDIVAWHTMGDSRCGLPIAFAQCGCTVDGWPNKALEASPASIGSGLQTLHDWATYYFMPLDLSASIDNKLDWESFSDFKKAIFVDRLRLLSLAREYSLYDKGIYDVMVVSEATGMCLQ